MYLKSLAILEKASKIVENFIKVLHFSKNVFKKPSNVYKILILINKKPPLLL
jgi:hypothetical protein